MGSIFVISSSFVTFLSLSSFWSTACPLVKTVCTYSGVRLLTSTLSLPVSSINNFWDGPIAGPPYPYSVRSLFAVGNFLTIIGVPIPIPYTTFTWWFPGASSTVMKRVSSQFRSQRSLPCVLSKLKMSLVFSSLCFRCYLAHFCCGRPPLWWHSSPIVCFLVYWWHLLWCGLCSCSCICRSCSRGCPLVCSSCIFWSLCHHPCRPHFFCFSCLMLLHDV